MKTALLTFALSCLALASSGENRVLLNDGWRFKLGDDTLAMRCDNPRLWEKWGSSVTLPHDWSIAFQPSEQATPGNEGGYYEAGLGWYRFRLTPKLLQGTHHWLSFDGVYQKATIYVNGREAARHDYGYTPFRVDITPFVDPTKENFVAVRVDNSAQKNCRWYSGSGIYRYVWLENTEDVYIDPLQTSLSAAADRSLSACVALVNDGTERCLAKAVLSVGGQSTETEVALEVGEHKAVTMQVVVPDAELWSPAHPALYEATITLSPSKGIGGRVASTLSRRVGFRTIEWSAEQGLRLNGEPVLVNGACVHHDNGLLGAVATRSSEARKVMLMKQAGFNLLRTSHNPPAEAFLDACDEQGMLVIDEAFDGWRTQKNPHDYHVVFDSLSRSDVQSMVLRDRHHASVIAWSIGNEVIERKDIRVVYTARSLKQAITEVDPERRPVTEALCAWDRDWEIYDPHAEVLDIAGYNYMLFKHASDHQRDPQRVIWQTESYPRDAFRNWQTVRDYPYVVGDIVWTGLDYLGESGIGGWRYASWPQGESWQNLQWPWHGAYCGDVDITGYRKPVSYYRDMLWNPKGQIYLAVYEPDGYIEPIKTTMWSTWPTWRSWSWRGWEQKPIDVVVYSRQPKVRLSLNGRIIDEKPTTEQQEFKAVFRLPYEPGVLVAEGIDENGSVATTDTLRTAGDPYALRCKVEPSPLKDPDLLYVTVEVVDKDGNLCPQADNVISVQLKGAGRMMAFGNADLRETANIQDNSHPAWRGRALLIVSAPKKGKLRALFSAEGLRSTSLPL